VLHEPGARSGRGGEHRLDLRVTGGGIAFESRKEERTLVAVRGVEAPFEHARALLERTRGERVVAALPELVHGLLEDSILVELPGPAHATSETFLVVRSITGAHCGTCKPPSGRSVRRPARPPFP